MSDEERRARRPQSMSRRYRQGLILVGVLCVLATLTAATLLFQRSYTERVDDTLHRLCATLAAGSRGSRPAWFFSSTMPSSCMARASAACCGNI